MSQQESEVPQDPIATEIHESFQLKRHASNSQLKQESKNDEENPAKRPRLDQDEKRDPLKLPDPCAQNILQYFSGKELLKLMEVSKHWNDYIESSNLLMDRALDKVLIRFDQDHRLNQNEFNFKPLKRNYKNVKSLFPQNTKIKSSGVLFPLIGYYTNSVETLQIKIKFMDLNTVQACDNHFDFPKLKKLCIVHGPKGSKKAKKAQTRGYPWEALKRFLESCTFPEVTHLYIPSGFVKDFLPDMIQKFPKLKALYSNYHPFESRKLQTRPLLEQIGFDFCSWKRINLYKDTLTEFHSYTKLYAANIIHLLTHFKHLKRVTLKYVYDLDSSAEDSDYEIAADNNIPAFPVHDKIEVFTCDKTTRADASHFNALLLALPSLKVLTTNYWEVKIRFLVCNMFNLEKFITSASWKLRNYRALQADPQPYFVNTSFMIEIKPKENLFWNYKEIFDNSE